MNATIITIGDEILIGQIVDTNTASISRKLNTIGLAIKEKTSIGDKAEEITECVQRAMAQSKVVIMTGGLGPTKDDITKTTLAEMFNSSLIYNEAEGEHIRTLLARRNIPFTDLNRSQALVPECCTVLHNAHGTAPGMWFDTEEGNIVISLPGVPFEMEHLMDEVVIPRLKECLELRSIVHKTLITRGIPESLLAERIEKWEDALPEYMHLAYLPAPNIVRLRLSAYDIEKESAERAIDEEFGKLREIIGENIVGWEGATLEQQVHDILTRRNLTLATAESCTGGTIASKFTAMAGASAYFLAGVVAYANSAKSNIIEVNSEDILRYGAVSESVARQMAEGVRRVAGADYAIATTGIAGPGGGSAEKPVGTVWMAVATPEGTIAQIRNCGTDRSQIISRASAYAIEMLYDQIKNM